MRKRISYLLSALVALMLTAIACGGGGKKEEPKDVAVISVSIQATLTLDVGDTQKLTPAFNPSNATNKNVTWSTSAAAIANVSNDGAVTALGAGSATITVTTADGNKTSRCDVTVIVPVASISLNESEITLLPGGQRALQSTVLPANATNKQVSWSSNYPAIAEVSDNGIVTAKAAGEAVITAVSKQDTTKKAECAVTVLPIIPVTGINLNKTQLTLDIGQKETLTATVLPTNATNPGLVWSSDSASVSVTQEGEVTALAAGTATIKAASAANPAVFGVCNITVPQPIIPVTGINLNKTQLTLDIGQKETLTATVLPTNATNPGLVWSSDSVSVSVTQEGVVTALLEGTAKITAAWAENPSLKAECAVMAARNPTVCVGQVWIADQGNMSYLWENGEAKKLNLSDRGSDALSVFVTGDDTVYVAGCEYDSNDLLIPTLYVNGNVRYLDMPAGFAEIRLHSVYVADGVEYAVGSGRTNDWEYYPVIWEGGVPSVYNSAQGDAYSVYVNAGKVYVAGYIRDGYIAVCWENGTRAPLQTPAGSMSTANSVFVSGENVYIAGYETDPDYKSYPRLWINKELHSLPCVTTGYAQSVYVSDGKVYVVGQDNINFVQTAILWVLTLNQDGTGIQGDPRTIILSNGVDGAMAWSVFVSGGNVYAAGYQKSSYSDKATIWKVNGEGEVTPTRLDDNNSQAKGVFVK